MTVYHVGTSGWMYSWNPDGLDWYASKSGLDTIELNMSFYRFPYPNQVRSWARKSSATGLLWSIKIHRSISHRRLLSEPAYDIWGRFHRLFQP